MKHLATLAGLLAALSSYGQTGTVNKQQAARSAYAIYQQMTTEICGCTTSTMRNNKPSTTRDSCILATVKQYTDTLKALGYDPADSVGKRRLISGIRLQDCRDVNALMRKEWEEEQAKKLLFKGEFVAQRQLVTGEYEVAFRNRQTREQKTLKSKNRFNEDMVKDFLPGYELTIEYEIVSNPQTGRDELYMKEGEISAVGTVPVTNSK